MKQSLALHSVALLFLFASCDDISSDVIVSDAATLKYDFGGEIQSTIILPGLKAECPNGRFLVTRDGLRPSHFVGIVVSRDLDSPGMNPIEATFDTIPDQGDYFYCTNDHDLLTLPNGDVLYITGAMSKRPISPKPDWFDFTFRNRLPQEGGPFGPGARTVVLTWRSIDGGKSFQYLSEFDPATVESGIGALPQFGASKDFSPWDAGGTDGQYTKIFSGGSDQLYLTFGIEGYNPVAGAVPYRPDSNNRVNKGILLTSKGGTSWKSLGMIDSRFWRLDMVPLNGNSVSQPIAFGLGTSVFIGKKTAPMHYSFLPGKELVPTNEWGWTSPLFTNNNKIFKGSISSNMFAHTSIGKVPGDNNIVMLVFPAMLSGNQNGCQLIFYDADNDSFAHAGPIRPTDKSAQSFIMHPTIIKAGNGPLLLYWYDVNGPALTCKIRGRIIIGKGTCTEDFDISRSGGAPYSFALYPLNATTVKFFGDYHTAGGYVGSPDTLDGKPVFTAHFYPVWNESADTIRYGSVAFSWQPGAQSYNGASSYKLNLDGKKLKMKELPGDIWKKADRSIDMKNAVSVRELEQRKVYRNRGK